MSDLVAYFLDFEQELLSVDRPSAEHLHKLRKLAEIVEKRRGTVSKDIPFHLGQIANRLRGFSAVVASLELSCDEGRHATLLQVDAILTNKEQIRTTGSAQDFQPWKRWFLANIACPYPNSTAKKQLVTAIPDTTQSQLSTWLTNARKRSGWTDIYRKWGNGSTEGMSTLLAAIDSPHQAWTLAPEARLAVKKMREYFGEGSGKDRVAPWMQEIIQKNKSSSELPWSSPIPISPSSRYRHASSGSSSSSSYGNSPPDSPLLRPSRPNIFASSPLDSFSSKPPYSSFSPMLSLPMSSYSFSSVLCRTPSFSTPLGDPSYFSSFAPVQSSSTSRYSGFGNDFMAPLSMNQNRYASSGPQRRGLRR